MGVLQVNTDRSKIFMGGNRTVTATYVNGTGGTVTISPGRVMGRITANNRCNLQDKDNTDGSQFPRWVAMSEHTVLNGGTAIVTLCYAGDIDFSMLSFASGETLASVVATTYTDSNSETVAISFGTIQDLLIANSHINPVSGTELSGYDNTMS